MEVALVKCCWSNLKTTLRMTRSTSASIWMARCTTLQASVNSFQIVKSWRSSTISTLECPNLAWIPTEKRLRESKVNRHDKLYRILARTNNQVNLKSSFHSLEVLISLAPSFKVDVQCHRKPRVGYQMLLKFVNQPFSLPVLRKRLSDQFWNHDSKFLNPSKRLLREVESVMKLVSSLVAVARRISM